MTPDKDSDPPTHRVTATRKTKTFKPRRGRPNAEQAAAISQAILSAATQLFLTIGFEMTTMEAIAKSAGIPKSTLYKRFADKTLLLSAVIEDRIKHWGETGNKQAKPPATDLQQRLTQQLCSVITWFATEEVRALSRMAFSPGEGSALVAKMLQENGYNNVVDNLEQDICLLAKTPPKDSRSVAVTLMSLLTGWIATRPFDEPVPPQEAAAFAKRAVELIINGQASW